MSKRRRADAEKQKKKKDYEKRNKRRRPKNERERKEEETNGRPIWSRSKTNSNKKSDWMGAEINRREFPIIGKQQQFETNVTTFTKQQLRHSRKVTKPNSNIHQVINNTANSNLFSINQTSVSAAVSSSSSPSSLLLSSFAFVNTVVVPVVVVVSYCWK